MFRSLFSRRGAVALAAATVGAASLSLVAAGDRWGRTQRLPPDRLGVPDLVRHHDQPVRPVQRRPGV